MSDSNRIQHLERLLENSRNLSASVDLEPFLQSIISLASELTGSEVSSILELDEGGENLRYLSVPWFHRNALQPVKVPVNGSLAGWVFRKGKPFVCADVSKEKLHFKGADQVTDFQTHSLLAVPVICKGETLGVLESVNKSGKDNYTEDDLRSLETLASQAAVAMLNTRLVAQVNRSQDEIAKVEKMKSDFIAVASHELRTPLGLIIGHSTFLREVIKEEHRPQMDIVIRNAMRLKEIVESIASMDNVQRGVTNIQRRTVSIPKVIDEVVEAFKDDARQKHLSLRTEIAKEDLIVAGDPAKVSLALGNLVKNAIAFTDPGGHIFIVAEKIPDYVKVSVIDDGVGIPLKDLPRIFERFYQVESHLTRKHGGMGLGLSVARVMVEMHSGRIWAESVEGKGSSFTFILPLDSSQPGAENKVFLAE